MTTLRIKRTSNSELIPSNTDIVAGELAINLATHKLYSSDGEEVFEIAGSSEGGSGVVSRPQRDLRANSDPQEIILSDQGKHLYLSNNRVLIPRNDEVEFPIGTSILIVTDNEGTETSVIEPKEYETGNLATIVSASYGYDSVWGITPGHRAELLKVEEDKWFLSGSTGTEFIDILDVPSSIQFTSNSSILNYDQSTDWNFLEDDYTVEIFFYYLGPITEGCPLINVTGTGGDNWRALWRLQLREFNPYGIALLMDNDDTIQIDGALTTNEWHHIAVTNEGTTVRVFLDGTEVAEETRTPNTTFPTVLQIGYVTPGFGYSKGYISTVHIVKGTCLYTENFTVPTEPIEPVDDSVLLLKFSNAKDIYKDYSPKNKVANTAENITHLPGVSPFS